MIKGMEEFRKPIPEEEILWRIMRYGWKNGKPWALIVPYFDARYAMDRLDECFGHENWDDVSTAYELGVICSVTIRDADNLIATTKTDGAQYSAVEGFKGGISDAFKRACVKHGLGRELYEKKDVWADVSLEPVDGWERVYDKKESKSFWWAPPSSNKPKGREPQDTPKDAMPKGDYDKAFDAVIKARTYEELATIKSMLGTREWTTQELDNLHKKIQKQNVLIQEGYYEDAD